MNLLIFPSDKHRSNSNKMQIFCLKFILTFSKIWIHYINTLKECLLTHLIRRKHFDHPINHLRPQRRSNLMIKQYILTSASIGRITHERKQSIEIILNNLMSILLLQLLWKFILLKKLIHCYSLCFLHILVCTVIDLANEVQWLLIQSNVVKSVSIFFILLAISRLERKRVLSMEIGKWFFGPCLKSHLTNIMILIKHIWLKIKIKLLLKVI